MYDSLKKKGGGGFNAPIVVLASAESQGHPTEHAKEWATHHHDPCQSVRLHCELVGPICTPIWKGARGPHMYSVLKSDTHKEAIM